MSELQLQALLRRQLNLRVGPEMAAYVQRQMGAAAGEIPVIAADARTGVAVRTNINLRQLRGSAAGDLPRGAAPSQDRLP